MATYQKRGKRWRAIVRKGGKSLSRSFDSKADAKTWAGEQEAEIARGTFADRRELKDRTLGTDLPKYPEEVGAQGTKRRTLERMGRELADTRLLGLTPRAVIEYARRRKALGRDPATVEQDVIYLRTFWHYAQTVWELPLPENPVTIARHQMQHEGLTAAPKERNRRLSNAEHYTLLGYFRGHWMADVIDFAILTAMRAGEIVRITWADLDEDKRLVTIRDRKHPRYKAGNDQDIPLLGEAWDIVQRQPKTDARIFPYARQTISNTFARACRELDIGGLRFHDLRHEGISRLFEQGYRIEQVSLISGHRDWAQLRRYTNLRPESLHNGP
jgi:integrase